MQHEMQRFKVIRHVGMCLFLCNSFIDLMEHNAQHPTDSKEYEHFERFKFSKESRT